LIGIVPSQFCVVANNPNGSPIPHSCNFTHFAPISSAMQYSFFVESHSTFGASSVSLFWSLHCHPLLIFVANVLFTVVLNEF